MKIKGFFKMRKNNDLSLAEELVYAIISLHSRNGECQISRSLISKESGIKKLDTITKHTNKLEKLGYISKVCVNSSGVNRKITYKINDNKEPFTIVMNSIFNNLKPNEISFVIKLAGLRLKQTACINFSNKEIIEKLGISKSTFYNYIKRAIELNIVFETSQGYLINTEFFPIFPSVNKETSELIKCALSQDSESRAYKAVYNACNNGFIGISDPYQYVYKCLTGEAFIKKKHMNSEVYDAKEYEF